MADSGGYKKNVGLVGSVSLLITSITGPGLVLIPLIYQQAGWFVPTLLFVFIGALAAIASLFVVESTNRFPGNENFERNVEFTVMVHQFYGRYLYYIFIFILFGSIQSTNVASIIGAAQVFDSLLVGLFGASCGWGISPISGIYCVTQVTNTNSPFGDNFMVGTLGFLIVLCIIIPLTQIDLNDNMLLQLISLFYNFVFLLTLIGTVAAKPVGDRITLRPFGQDLSQVVGQVLFNYTMANTVPSWMNVKHPKVSAKKSIWLSFWISLILYVFVGVFGGIGYIQSAGTNLLQAMYSDATVSKGAHGWITFVYILFPVLTYITSIPINMIVIRLNFLAARLTSADAANWWAVYFPFLLSIPFQTGDFITYFGTYTSLTFQALCNFFCPFLIFFFLNKRKLEMAQSVLDELEFLDINAGVKNTTSDDDDFDYIYHLPTANPEQIRYRDPFKREGLPQKKANSMAESMSKLSMHSRHSIREIKSMLDPSLGSNSQLTKQHSSSMARKRTRKEGLLRNPSGKRPDDGWGEKGGSMFSLGGSGSQDLGSQSNLGSSVAQSFDIKDIRITGDVDIGDDQMNLIPIRDGGDGKFRALPDFMYRYFNPNHVALFCFVCCFALVMEVIIAYGLK